MGATTVLKLEEVSPYPCTSSIGARSEMREAYEQPGVNRMLIARAKAI